MKNAKKICIVLLVLFSLLLVLDLGLRAFTPAAVPAFPQNGGDMRPDFASGQPNPSPLSGIVRYWIPIAVVCALADAACVFFLLKSKKQTAPGETAVNSMPPLDEDDDEPPRAGNHGYWTAAICAVLAVVLIITSLPTASKDSVSVNTKVISGKPETNTISTVLSGGGTLTATKAVKVEIPQILTVESYQVKNGDVVDPGDVLATVDPITVRTAVAELQSVIKALDYDLVREKNKDQLTTLSSPCGGRIKQLYLEPEQTVSDIVYEHGALLLLSLDGRMAVQIPGKMTIGTPLNVTLSNGTVETGRVSAYSDDITTVTIPDTSAPCDDEVVITALDGTMVGSGKLYVHCPLKVVGYYGTVSRVSVSLNQQVYEGTPLASLRDMGHTADYSTLLDLRRDMEEQMDMLIKLSFDGTVRAESHGIVTGVNEDIDYVPLDAEEEHVPSNATPGVVFAPLYVEDMQPKVMLLADGDGNTNAGEISYPVSGKVENADSETITVAGQVVPIGGKIVKITEGNPDDPNANEIRPGDTVYIDEDIVFVTKAPYTGGSGEGSGDKPTDPESGDIAGTVAKVSKGEITLKTKTGFETVKNSGQIVLINGKPAKFSDIKQGDNVTVSGNMITVMSMGSASEEIEQQMREAMERAMKEAMGGMMGGFSFGGSYGSSQVPVYMTYDLTKLSVLSVIPTEEMTVTIPVDELDILTLSEGMTASITLDAIKGQSFTGEITHINRYGTNEGGNTKYEVEVTLPRTESMLEGMNASVKFVTAVSEPVSTIPAAALQEQGGKTYIYTTYDAKTDTLGGLTEVDTGISDGTLVQIISGITADTAFYYRYSDSMVYQFV